VDRTLPRASRLGSRKQFLQIYEQGQRVHSAYFVLFGVAGASGRTRLGITATKKFGSAVLRNRIKRVVREIFRNHRDALPHPVDLVVNVKASAREQTFARLAGDLDAAMRTLSRRLAP
jgi:ribonuclease P protein component